MNNLALYYKYACVHGCVYLGLGCTRQIVQELVPRAMPIDQHLSNTCFIFSVLSDEYFANLLRAQKSRAVICPVIVAVYARVHFFF
jgi:hypothetical protein